MEHLSDLWHFPLPLPPLVSAANRESLTAPRFAALITLLVLLILCIAFSWTTRDAMAHLPRAGKHGTSSGAAGHEKTLVDLSPWQTAQALAPFGSNRRRNSIRAPGSAWQTTR